MSDDKTPYLLVGESQNRMSSGSSGMQNIPKDNVDPAKGPGETVMVEMDVCKGKVSVVNIGKPILNNTLWNVSCCSLMAFLTLLQERNIEHEITYKEGSSDPAELVITWDRMAHDEMGYHEGYELFSAHCPIFAVSKIGGPIQLPYGLDPWCLMPTMFDPMLVSAPGERDSYMPPDQDFVFQEFEYLLRAWDNDLPLAEFDGQSRTWTLGGWSWHVGDESVRYW